MSILIYRGTRPSASARSLSRVLSRCRRNTTSNPMRNITRRFVINWGTRSSVWPAMRRGTLLLNKPEAVATAVNKLSALRSLQAAGNVAIPNYWTSPYDVNRTGIVVARTLLTSSEGRGIVIVREGEGLPTAPLYTQYIRKSHEYRAHVFLGEVIMLQEKRKESGFEQTDDQKLIRNHDGGWRFVVNDIRYPAEDTKSRIETIAINAISALGLDFGAVDIIVSRRDYTPYVLEVNTAPGIESPTVLDAYKTAIEKWVRNNE